MREADIHQPGETFRNGLLLAAILWPMATHPVEAQNALDAMRPGYFDCGLPIKS